MGCRIQPSAGTSSTFSGSQRSRLSRMAAQEMESVQVYAASPISTSSGSTGMGLPSGTGSVWYLSLPVPVSIIMPLISSYSPVAPAPISAGVWNSGRSAGGSSAAGSSGCSVSFAADSSACSGSSAVGTSAASSDVGSSGVGSAGSPVDSAGAETVGCSAGVGCAGIF